MISEGATNRQIIESYPTYFTKIDKIEKARQTLLEDEGKSTWRDIETTYLFGETGTGKTRSVMDKYGYPNVFRVTNYDHPFDNYQGQDVIIFEEYRSSLPISELLNYLDGYPCELPCRYSNKFANYTKVFIISNIPLEQQYRNIQNDQPATWKALKRRIDHIIERRHVTDEPFCEGEEVVQIEIQDDNIRERT